MIDSPFENIESAQQYVRLLLAEVEEASAGVQEDAAEARRDQARRRQDALHIVDYKLKQLKHHLVSSGRLLNDLKMLRRLLVRDQSGTAPSLEAHDTSAPAV